MENKWDKSREQHKGDRCHTAHKVANIDMGRSLGLKNRKQLGGKFDGVEIMRYLETTWRDGTVKIDEFGIE